MDDIVSRVVQTLAENKENGTRRGEFAVFVTGDHGMTEEGGHGGSSSHETEVGMISFHSNRSERTAADKAQSSIEQIDLVIVLISWQYHR